MERSIIIDKVKSVLIQVLKHDNFEMKEDLTAADVAGWDSLSHMIIVTEIESVFKIKFKFKELNKLNNLNSLIELIQSKLES